MSTHPDHGNTCLELAEETGVFRDTATRIKDAEVQLLMWIIARSWHQI